MFNNMKLFLVLLVAASFVGVYSDEAINLSREDELECAKQHKVDAEEMAHVRTSSDHVPTKDEMCFGACVLKKSGLMGADGKFTDVFINKMKNLVSLCPPEYGADECETAGNMYKCMSKHRAELAKKAAA